MERLSRAGSESMSNAERGNQVQQSTDGKTWQDAVPLKGPSMWFSVHRWASSGYRLYGWRGYEQR